MTSKIPLAGVIGSPISHSKSPKLHGHWLRSYGLPGHYIPMDIHYDDLKSALQLLPKLGFVGLNVTLPHKEAVLGLADKVSDQAALIGAANTLTFGKDGQIHADNTDSYGFLANLREGAPDWRADSGPAAVIGAGGASRAVIAALIEAGAPEIRLTNRTRNRAEALRSEFGTKVVVQDWVQAGQMMEEAALLVNTSSLGMKDGPEFKIPLDDLPNTAVVTDIVYTPLDTGLLKQARAKGCKTVDGLGMLLHQAVPGFERWFGKRPEVTEDTRRVILSA